MTKYVSNVTRARGRTSWPTGACCLLLLASMLAAGGEPQGIRLATGGGDAWTFSKPISGRFPPQACDSVLVHSPAGSVAATLDGDRFFARALLRSGPNEVTAECRRGDLAVATSAVQRWHVRLENAPKAWIRVRTSAAGIELDAGRTERAPSAPAPIVRRLWTARDGNPASLVTASGQRLRDGQVEGEHIVLAAPRLDGDYVVELQVTDALGRTDRAATMFRVEHGRARTLDLAEQHPLWVDSAVLYGIAPHFFGDQAFDGITERLDEIAALGATAIWLSPLTESPSDDFGYAVLDHFDVRDRFGDEAELRALIERAHSLGLKVVMDFVPNHVSERHPYYRSAEHDGARSAYYSWFDRTPDGEVRSYFDWSELKNLNYDNPEVQAYVIAAFVHWIREFGVDGFRVDASWAVRQRAPEFWPRWREELKRIEPDVFLLAEASARDGYYVENGFDAAYDWTSSLGEWAWEDAFDQHRPDLDALRAALTNRGAGFPPDTLVLRFLNNNDTGQRFVTEHGPGLTRAAAALLFTVPGVPLIYNGDEVGAEFEPYDEGPPLEWSDPHGLTSWYTRLAELRRNLSALTSRRLELIETDRDDEVLAFLRPNDAGASVLVVINFRPGTVRVRLPRNAPGATLDGSIRDLLTGTEVQIDSGRLVLDAHQAVVLQTASSSR